MRHTTVRRGGRLVATGLAALLLAMTPFLTNPRPAHANVFWSGVCKVNVTVDFGTYVVTKHTDLGIGYTMSGSGTCTGVPANPNVGISGDGFAEVVNCAELVTQIGGATFSFDSGFPPGSTESVASGNLSTAIDWVFPGTDATTWDGTAHLDASDTSQLTTCVNSGLSQFHYSGRLVFQDPTLS